MHNVLFDDIEVYQLDISRPTTPSKTPLNKTWQHQRRSHPPERRIPLRCLGFRTARCVFLKQGGLCCGCSTRAFQSSLTNFDSTKFALLRYLIMRIGDALLLHRMIVLGHSRNPDKVKKVKERGLFLESVSNVQSELHLVTSLSTNFLIGLATSPLQAQSSRLNPGE